MNAALMKYAYRAGKTAALTSIILTLITIAGCRSVEQVDQPSLPPPTMTDISQPVPETSAPVDATSGVIGPIVATAIQSDTGGPISGGPVIVPAESVTPGPTNTPIPIPQGSGGIVGQALLGPICPVQREDDPCPDQPYPTTITVLNQSGAAIATVNTDAQGVFRIDLPAGTYTLVPQNPPDSPFPVAGPQEVIVQAGQYTSVIVPYDTGIR